MKCLKLTALGQAHLRRAPRPARPALAVSSTSWQLLPLSDGFNGARVLGPKTGENSLRSAVPRHGLSRVLQVLPLLVCQFWAWADVIDNDAIDKIRSLVPRPLPNGGIFQLRASPGQLSVNLRKISADPPMAVVYIIAGEDVLRRFPESSPSERCLQRRKTCPLQHRVISVLPQVTTTRSKNMFLSSRALQMRITSMTPKVSRMESRERNCCGKVGPNRASSWPL